MHADLLRTGRWGVKAVGGLAANLALLTLWVDVVGFAAWWAVALNWVLISAAGYVITDRWVFGTMPSPSGVVANVRRFVGMQTTMGIGKFANWLIYVALLPVFDYRISWAIGAVTTFIVTFAGNRYLWVGSSIKRSAEQ